MISHKKRTHVVNVNLILQSIENKKNTM